MELHYDEDDHLEIAPAAANRDPILSFFVKAVRSENQSDDLYREFQRNEPFSN